MSGASHHTELSVVDGGLRTDGQGQLELQDLRTQSVNVHAIKTSVLEARTYYALGAEIDVVCNAQETERVLMVKRVMRQSIQRHVCLWNLS